VQYLAVFSDCAGGRRSSAGAAFSDTTGACPRK